jgi:hypothetical protein
MGQRNPASPILGLDGFSSPKKSWDVKTTELSTGAGFRNHPQ